MDSKVQSKTPNAHISASGVGAVHAVACLISGGRIAGVVVNDASLDSSLFRKHAPKSTSVEHGVNVCSFLISTTTFLATTSA